MNERKGYRISLDIYIDDGRNEDEAMRLVEDALDKTILSHFIASWTIEDYDLD